MKKKLIVLAGYLFGLTPVVVLAQTQGIVTGGSQNVSRYASCASVSGATTLETIICKINELLGIIVPVLIALGVVYFIWGVIQYAIGTDEEVKSSGRNKMIHGIIALAVIIGMWGLVGILNRTFGVGAATVVPPVVPGFNN